MLYIFGGLPGTGKSTLASRLAGDLKAVYLRVDTVGVFNIKMMSSKREGGGS